jgi:hypothetical protein
MFFSLSFLSAPARLLILHMHAAQRVPQPHEGAAYQYTQQSYKSAAAVGCFWGANF